MKISGLVRVRRKFASPLHLLPGEDTKSQQCASQERTSPELDHTGNLTYKFQPPELLKATQSAVLCYRNPVRWS